MDKKYNENWIVVIGQGFAFEVTHEVKHVLWMYAPHALAPCPPPEAGSPPQPHPKAELVRWHAAARPRVPRAA